MFVFNSEAFHTSKLIQHSMKNCQQPQPRKRNHHRPPERKVQDMTKQ